MEIICSSEATADYYLTTRRHIPDDSTLQGHRCENFNSTKFEAFKIRTPRDIFGPKREERKKPDETAFKIWSILGFS
jgi:hypothetical protein